jgi:WD repeat-containing protein 6
LTAESLTSKEIVAQEQAFEFQSIHGIKTQDTSAWEEQSTVGSTSISLLIWGGHRLAVGKITFASSSDSIDQPPASLAIGSEWETEDWILDANFAKQSSTIAYLVTAHNDVFMITLDPLHDLVVVISKVASGPSSILYSAHIKPVSATNILVAAGTVFGEVIAWLCYLPASGISDFETNWQSRTSHVFRGHTGSIFGVCLSDRVDPLSEHEPRRLLASCSDDRTIRIWDVSDCDVASQTALNVCGQHQRLLPQTGFGSIANASIATSWGHSSRIWGVEFVHLSDGSFTSSLRLISTGEDATCQVWELDWRRVTTSGDTLDHTERPLQLSQASMDHFHFGKHIWSHVHHQKNKKSLMFTGGGDGKILARSVRTAEAEDSSLSIWTPFGALFRSLRPQLIRNDSVRTKDSIKQYVFASDNVILATTNYGHVIKGAIEEDKQNTFQTLRVNWTPLCDATNFGAIEAMTGDILNGLVYIGGANGNICAYHHTTQSINLLATTKQKISNMFTRPCSTRDHGTNVRYLLVFSTVSMSAKVLEITHVNRGPSNQEVSMTVELNLPSKFQPTAFTEISGGKLIVLGSRSGAITVYRDAFHQREIAEEIPPDIYIRQVHESDSVTHLQSLPRSEHSKQDVACCELLSTGRDGSYAIHKLIFQDSNGRSITPVLMTLHRSRPPFGPNIEGASIIMTSPSDMNLLLYGFDGKRFVVWNESTSSEVMSIPCGGAHRSWAYCDFLNTQLETSSHGGSFAWTKAGVFNMVRFVSPSHKIIQPGGHGREIKAMALYNSTLGHSPKGSSNRRLVATGAEDTDVRLWVVCTYGEPAKVETQCSRPQENASCILILKKHTTGLQHLSFCRKLLFSSAGCEELFIWKINFCVAVVDIGSIFQAELPKHVATSDLRITSFEVFYVASNGKNESMSELEHFHIYAAYSNSMIRAFQYTDDDGLAPKDRFQLLGQGSYNTTCLTNICGLPECFPWIVAASTNGALTVWPGFHDYDDLQHGPVVLSPTAEYYIHQNAILALQTTSIAPEYHLLLTGGDDNAFGITLMYSSIFEETVSQTVEKGNSLPTPRIRFQTLLIPRAHAAAITALELLESRKEGCLTILTAASTSNDQRLKVWRITLNEDELSRSSNDPGRNADAFGPEVLDTIDVQLVREMWTSVADASGMILIPDTEDPGTDAVGDVELLEVDGARRRSKRVMVAGIGMEMSRIALDAG